MRISLEALTVLDAIDRRGTFAAAAEELHRVPSSLSYLVQKLEGDLGVTIFDRSGHRAQLTKTGALLLEEGRRLLQAAATLEARAKRVETGWETELSIAVDAMVPFSRVMPALEAFYADNPYTRLRFGYEVLGGSWDALVTQRADLAIGAVGDPPPGVGLSFQPLGQLLVLFCVAPQHPLATTPEPLEWETLVAHRIVSVADTSHRLPVRNLNVIPGQDNLSVPNMDTKLEALLAGLGYGHLPACIALPHIERGELVVKQLRESRPPQRFYLAWRSNDQGPALRWWIKRFDDPDFINDRMMAAEKL